MVKWPGRRDSAANAAQASAPVQPQPKPGATDGFPRGLPDGDRNKPGAVGRWPSSEEVAAALPEWKPGMFLLGRDDAGRYRGHDDDRHVLTVAGSRAGKGVSLIVPNLLLWPGSVIAIDPKGELATLTASRRSDIGSPYAVPMTPGEGEVYALDPFGRVTGSAKQHAFAGFNPMADIDVETDAGYDRCSQLADALIIQSEGDGAHWTQGAQYLLRVLIYVVAATKDPDEKNLITVRRLLTAGAKAQDAQWQVMAESKDTVIAAMGKALAGMRESERSSIMGTALTQTAFLDAPEMAGVLSSSSFRLEDLKEKRITVYLCLPSMRLATHGKWFRMFVSMALDAMERTGPIKKGQPRVLFCLDEFAAIGRMESVEKAAGQIASFGVKIWPVIQDIPQLVRDYRSGWETFMGNAGLLTFFGNTDLTSSQHISARLGETEIVRTTHGGSVNWQKTTGDSKGDPIAVPFGGQVGVSASSGFTESGGQSEGETIQTAPLMQASEIVRNFARERGNILVLIPGKPPCALHRVSYFSQEDAGLFAGLYDPVEGQDPPHTTRMEREERDR